MATSRRKVVDDFRIPDAFWERIAPLLPRVRRSRKGGRPPLPQRQVLDGIFYVLRTGCQWKAAPPEFGSGSSLHRYFQRWQKRGVFRKLWPVALAEYDGQLGIDWDWQSIDGSMTKAPLGGKKDGQKPHGSRQNRYQAVGVDRWPWSAGGVGGGRGQPTGHGVGRDDPAECARRTPRADQGPTPAPVRGQGLRLPVGSEVGGRVGLHRPHRSQEDSGQPTH
jgi:transposase